MALPPRLPLPRQSDPAGRIGMGIFELGGYLLLLKEGCAHGEFIETLERLGVNYRAANKYMAVTRRFANVPTSAHLEKLGFSKMAELLPLDDDQTDDLVEEGQTGELSLDDVGRIALAEFDDVRGQAPAPARRGLFSPNYSTSSNLETGV